MRKVINAINELTILMYGHKLTDHAIVSILDNGKASALKLKKELELAIQEEDSIHH